MTGQQTLDGGGHDPLKAGIQRRRADDWTLRIPDWHHANHGRQIVGTCRQSKCGGLLMPIDTHTSIHEGREITWYAAECLSCGHEVNAPNGHYLARSSRRGEMPQDWWARRTRAFAAAKQAAERARQQREAA